MTGYQCIHDYQLIEEGQADQAKIHVQKVHGATLIAPSESSAAHNLDIVIANSWCLLVSNEFANKARVLIGLPD